MVKSVAESRGVVMPSFGGYISWTVRYLIPTLVSMVCIFIAEPLWVKGIGLALALLLVGQSMRIYLVNRDAAHEVYSLIGVRARGEYHGKMRELHERNHVSRPDYNRES